MKIKSIIMTSMVIAGVFSQLSAKHVQNYKNNANFNIKVTPFLLGSSKGTYSIAPGKSYTEVEPKSFVGVDKVEVVHGDNANMKATWSASFGSTAGSGNWVTSVKDGKLVIGLE